MTRIAFAIRIAAVVFSITPAVAADLGRFPPAGSYPPTPMVRVYNWTGCYLGAQLGGAFADNNINGVLAGFLFIQKDGATPRLSAAKSAATFNLHAIGLSVLRLTELGPTCSAAKG